jgi:hypothetical protein
MAVSLILSTRMLIVYGMTGVMFSHQAGRAKGGEMGGHRKRPVRRGTTGRSDVGALEACGGRHPAVS